MRRVICKHVNISYMFYATGCLTLVSNHGNIVGYIFRLGDVYVCLLPSV